MFFDAVNSFFFKLFYRFSSLPLSTCFYKLCWLPPFGVCVLYALFWCGQGGFSKNFLVRLKKVTAALGSGLIWVVVTFVEFVIIDDDCFS
ncbi:Uncharacterised protein [Moraxella atlantae]|uniref:Uncharacterized protein n=1 Tax=Faucicola atlantae TaxID=34059 RepID=A0A378Q0N8_9GAMM|nr:Uncharacterised protein [Moraxella atlantae]